MPYGAKITSMPFLRGKLEGVFKDKEAFLRGFADRIETFLFIAKIRQMQNVFFRLGLTC